MARNERLSLDVVSGVTDAASIEVANGSISLEAYSRFKHGDSDVANQFGTRLADSFADMYSGLEDKKILVTSSAYKVAPPASNALVNPFVTRLRERLPVADISQFKIDRTVLTQGDYASMPLEMREEVMKRNGLKIPPDVDVNAAEAVVALDDIFVTGSHEVTIEKLFDRHGLDSDRYYAYILRIGEGIDDPSIEAAINHCAIKSLRDVAIMANSVQTFQPNARLAKMIVSSAESEIVAFTNGVEDIAALEAIYEHIMGDELQSMPGYALGVQLFTRYLRRRLHS